MVDSQNYITIFLCIRRMRNISGQVSRTRVGICLLLQLIKICLSLYYYFDMSSLSRIFWCKCCLAIRSVVPHNNNNNRLVWKGALISLQYI